MKKVWLILTCFLVLLVGCSRTEPVQIGTVAEYENCKAELLEAEFDTAENTVKVYVAYTNNGSDGMYMFESFVVRAFQNDTELTNLTDINDDGKLITEVKDGQSITGTYIFELTDSSTVEVRICTPTANEELLTVREYNCD